jgi:hypothetical protein
METEDERFMVRIDRGIPGLANLRCCLPIHLIAACSRDLNSKRTYRLCASVGAILRLRRNEGPICRDL